MAKYIDKDELEAFLNELIENLGDSDYDRGYLCAIDSIFGCYLNSIEVKDVDLDKELKDWMRDNTDSSDFFDLLSLVKHFFELGLRVSNPLTWEDIRKIDTLCCKVEMEHIPKEEEHYQEVLKRFKAQK